MTSSIEFSTAIKQIFFRSKQGNALVAKLVIAKRDDESTGYIHLGRFSNNYAGSKFLISCTREEAEWFVDVIPALIKNARAAKPNQYPIVLEKKEFERERSFELSVSKFKSFKQIDITQSFVRDDNIVTRCVSVPVAEMQNVCKTFKQMLIAMEIKLNADWKQLNTFSFRISHILLKPTLENH